MSKQSDNRKKWTDREIELLCRYYTVMTAKNISTMLNRSIYSVYAKARDICLSSYNTSKEKEIVKQMRINGMSVDDICVKTGWSKRTVYRRIHASNKYKSCHL